MSCHTNTIILNTVNQNPEDGFMDAVKEVMEMVDVTVEEAVDRGRDGGRRSAVATPEGSN